jgi:hypothetical protein
MEIYITYVGLVEQGIYSQKKVLLLIQTSLGCLMDMLDCSNSAPAADTRMPS